VDIPDGVGVEKNDVGQLSLLKRPDLIAPTHDGLPPCWWPP
jgi:hypothetical protein